MKSAAHLVVEIKRRGGDCFLRDGKLVVTPRSIVDAELHKGLRETGREVREVLRQQENGDRLEVSRSAPALPGDPPTPDVPACELCWIAGMNPPLLVRLCAESSHWHDDATITFDSVEVGILNAWATVNGVQRLSPGLRDRLFALKQTFGGRIDATTFEPLGAAQ